MRSENAAGNERFDSHVLSPWGRTWQRVLLNAWCGQRMLLDTIGLFSCSIRIWHPSKTQAVASPQNLGSFVKPLDPTLVDCDLNDLYSFEKSYSSLMSPLTLFAGGLV